MPSLPGILYMAVLGTVFSAATCCQAEITVVSGPLATNGEFHMKDKVRRSLSGVACPVSLSERYVCLVAFDEGAEGRTISISDQRYEVSADPVVLGAEGSELDNEGVGADDRFYYVTGSHSNKRKDDCSVNEDSHQVVRVAYDPKTGLPLRNKKGELQDVNRDYDLSSVLSADLKKSLNQCLGSKGNGFDIEGIAVYRGMLYLGLRGPVLKDPISSERSLAYVVEAETSPSQSDQPVRQPFLISVERGMAIRDLTATEEGILLLLGPDDNNGNVGWSVSFWDPNESADRDLPITPIELGRLDLADYQRSQCDKEVKPEGMALLGARLESNRAVYRLAIFSDGMCDGGPVIVDAKQ